MKKILSCWMVMLCLVSSVAIASSQVVDPVMVLDKAAQKMLHSLKVNHKKINKNPSILYRIVNKILVPHIDLDGMSRSVLGRRIWSSITPQQQQAFNVEFTKLIVRTYASALSAYTDEKVKFYPIRGGYRDRNRVQVMSVIERDNGPNIPVNYRMIRIGNTWKVYDFSVEGISLIRSFQSQFATQLSQNSFSSVLQTLTQHNRKVIKATG